MSELIALTKNQIKQIRDRGYSYVMTSGGLKKITMKDLLVDRDEAARVLKENPNE